MLINKNYKKKISKKGKTMSTKLMESNEWELLNPLSIAKLQTDEGDYHPAGPEMMYDENPKYYRWYETEKCCKRQVNIRQEDVTYVR